MQCCHHCRCKQNAIKSIARELHSPSSPYFTTCCVASAILRNCYCQSSTRKAATMAGEARMPIEFPAPLPGPRRKLDPETPATLSDFLRPTNVSFESLERRYPFLPLLQTMLGAVPNHLCMTEQFPPAFTTQNTIVPALLMLPFSCSSSLSLS